MAAQVAGIEGDRCGADPMADGKVGSLPLQILGVAPGEQQCGAMRCGLVREGACHG
ncbi:hypothetical protein ACFQU2_32105 [Siccirubricoccus deserti]